MKKVVLVLSIVLFLAGCYNQNKNDELIIIAPTGAPAIAFYNHLDNDKFQTNTQPSNIQAAMVNGEYDIAIIDVISGVKLINQGAPYLLASVLTFGNYYILSLGNDDNEVMNNDDIIVSFGHNLTPDLIFKNLYPDIEVDYYVNGVAEVSGVALSSKIDNKTVNYVFIAQPVMQKVLQSNKNSFVYQDIQELFEEKHGINGIPQAALYVKNNLNVSKKELVNEFLNKLEEDINTLLDDHSLLLDLDNDKFSTKIGIPTSLASSVISNNNGVNLGFKDVSNYLSSINTFFEIMGLESINNDLIYHRVE